MRLLLQKNKESGRAVPSLLTTLLLLAAEPERLAAVLAVIEQTTHRIQGFLPQNNPVAAHLLSHYLPH
jgi:hypothetical protein